MSEQQLQRRIIKLLEADGWYVIKLIRTTKNGIPDLLCHKDGRSVYIEVKLPGKKPTKIQDYRMDELRRYGIQSITTTTTDECTTKLHAIIWPMASTAS